MYLRYRPYLFNTTENVALPPKKGFRRFLQTDDRDPYRLNTAFWFYKKVPRPFGPLDLNERLEWDVLEEDWELYKFFDFSLSIIFKDLNTFGGKPYDWLTSKIELMKAIDKHFNVETRLGGDSFLFTNAVSTNVS